MGESLTEFLRGIPLFSKLNEEELNVLSSRLHIVKLRSGAKAIIQGEKGDAFYCVVSGKLHVIIEDEYCREHIVNELGAGSSFGETALLERVPRTASVVAVKSSTLIELGRKEFDEFVVRSAGGGEKVTDMIRIGKMIMEGGGIFSYLPPCQINRLVVMLKREIHGAGDIIFRQGDDGERFYIINKGKVFVDSPGMLNSGRRVLLGKGDFFGEIALIKNVPRTATLTAAEDVELLYLTKSEFYDFLRHNVRFGVQFDEIVDRRITENNCAWS
jgi:cAMP-dependent protein kinase regulator